MRNEKRYKKAKEASNKAIMASVTVEMGHPRMAKSSRIATDKQINARDGKPVPRPVGTK
jgi:hypothetical protein